MKKLILLFFLLTAWSKSYSQTVIQTYTDRCTNVVYTFSVPFNGQTVVAFYNRSQVFTAAQFTDGTLQAWLEETYLWWSALNPCSAAQAESTTAQQTAQQTTQAATQAATAAASAPPPPPPATNTTSPPPATGTTNTSSNATSNTADTSSTSNTDSTSSSQSSGSSSSSSNESTGGGESGGDSSGGSGEGGSSDTESKQEETKTEETKSEDSKSEESSESEEKVEEEKKEESKEEEKKEESEEESSEEESEEESDSESEKEKEEEKKKEKKKNLAPPILAANVMSMQMLDGTWSTAASFGMSQSSLTGQETYSANAMIWTNFKQFSLALSKTKLHFWSEYEDISYVYSQKGTRTPAINFKTGERYKDRQNQIHHVGTTSFNYMNIFGTNVITGGYSHVILGQQDNFWKGFAGGYAAMGSLIILPESLLLSPSLTFFGTKPIAFRSLPRWGFAPMIAVSLSPIQINKQKKEVNVVWNEYFNYIIGTNVNFKLTQRFAANLGINTINNTNPIIPTTFAVTIGARFAF